MQRHPDSHPHRLDRSPRLGLHLDVSENIDEKMLRLGIGLNVGECDSDQFGYGVRSLSDSELDKTSSLTSEFMELPNRLTSMRLTPPLPSSKQRRKLHLDLSFQFRPHSSPNADHYDFSDVPRIELSAVDVPVHHSPPDQGYQAMGNDLGSHSPGRRYAQKEDPPWLPLGPLASGLDARSHALLSPRDSNASINSCRSSNADSAIELLTPDEELAENQPSPDFTHWDQQPSTSPLAGSTSPSNSSVHSYASNLSSSSARPGSSTHKPSSMCSSTVFPNIQTNLFASYKAGPHDLTTSLDQRSVRKDHSLTFPSSDREMESVTDYDSVENIDHERDTVDQFAHSAAYLRSKLTHHSHSVENADLEIQHHHLRQMRSIHSEPIIKLPSVIISDFSTKTVDKCSQTLDTDFSSSFSSSLLGNPFGYQRSLSCSSVSSESSLSIMSDSSQDLEDVDFSIAPARKVSLMSGGLNTKCHCI